MGVEIPCPVRMPHLHKVLVTLFVLCVLVWDVHAGCGGSCGACARRYGCMTPAWGKCCTQFFMHNGRKRASGSKGGSAAGVAGVAAAVSGSVGAGGGAGPPAPEKVIESIIEYIRLKSKVSKDRDLIEDMRDNISAADDVTDDVTIDDDVVRTLGDAIASYGSLQNGGGLPSRELDEYKHR